MDRMFQDAAGLIPAFEAGHPVGLVKRLAGTVDAAQATALSRPALGRWPKGAKARNLVRGSGDFSASSVLWLPSRTSNGVTFTKLGEFTEGSRRFVRYALSGTKTNGSGNTGLINSAVFPSPIPVKLGDIFISSFESRIFEGAGILASSSDGIRMDTNEFAVSGMSVRSAPSSVQKTGEWVRHNATLTVTDERTVEVRASLGVRITEGLNVDGVVIDVASVQIERGNVMSDYQPLDNDGVPLAGYGSVRNLANGVHAYDDPTQWPLVSSHYGITATKLGTGLEGGVPYVDYEVKGTLTMSPASFFTVRQIEGAKAGDTFIHRAKYRLLSGSLGGAGFRSDLTYSSNDAYMGAFNGAQRPSGTLEVSTASGTIPEGATVILYLNRLSGAVGSVVDAVVRISEQQCEYGTTQTPLQLSFGPNNITEPGVDDVWFLANDGNDALPATLPAGTYGIAWVNPAGGISYATETLAAEGTIDALRGTRMADVIIRQGDFTAAEKAIIEAEWSQIAA